MAKFVVSGRVDCAAYARAEMLADQLKVCLPDFHVHKVSFYISSVVVVCHLKRHAYIDTCAK